MNQLFSYLPSNKLASFSCGHIIPTSSLQTLVVSKGPRGGVLEYKVGKQSDPDVVGVFNMPDESYRHDLLDCRIGTDFAQFRDCRASWHGSLLPVI